MRRVQGIVQILDMQFDTEARLKVPAKHHRRFCVHNRRAGQAAADCLIYQFRIGSCFLCEGQSLGYCRNVYRHHNLICQFSHVAGTKAAYIHNGTCHHHQHVIIFVKQFFFTAYHYGQGSVDGFRLPAGYWRIHHINA